MTNQEAQNALANLKRYMSGGGAVDRVTNKAIDIAIEALGAQPEPCEDAVSRAWLLAEYDRQHQGPPGGARKIIETAPPVMPKQRTEKWINGKCNKCGEHAPFYAMASTYHESNFCPNCGAKMEGEGNGEVCV